jgi:hypothetical protein
MMDPEEQLRRLAAGRAEQVEPFVPDPSEAEVIPLLARRWPVSIAAAVLAIAAVGAGSFAVFGTSEETPSSEFAVESSPDMAGTTSTVLSDLVIPDVVGNSAEDALAELEEAGFDAEFSVLWVEPDDKRLNVVTEVIPDLAVPGSNTVEVVVARLAPRTQAHAACDRPAHTMGDLDDDTRLDAIFPRWTDGVLTELEVCTAAGGRSAISGLSLGAITHVGDIDLNGFDDIVVSTATNSGTTAPGVQRSHLFNLREGTETTELVEIDVVLQIGPRDDGTNEWWGCFAFTPDSSAGAERLAIGTWWDLPDGDIEWRLTETFIAGGGVTDGEVVGGTGPEIPGRAGCLAGLDPAACAVSDLRVSLVGDVDGDGVDDLVAPRDNLLCLGNGVIAPIGDVATNAEVWFLDDIDDDGRLEVFLGDTSSDSLAVRPFTFGAAGEVSEYVRLDGLAFEECCTQDTVKVTAPNVWRRWFSCVEPSGGQPARLVWGRYQISEEGLVRWTAATLPVVAEPSAVESDDETVALVPEIFEVMVDGEPTDAWIPGNGCRSGNGVWRAPASLEFAEDGTATASSIEAFNESVQGDDIDRRFAQVREALDIGRRLQSASGYREVATAGLIEISGLPDDSVAALRWEVTFTEDGSSVVDVQHTWVCQPERGHEAFSAEFCA